MQALKPPLPSSSLERFVDYFEAATEVGKALTSQTQLSPLLHTLMDAVSRLLSPKHWSLMLLDDATQELYFEIAVGSAAEAIRDMRLTLDDGVVGWVARQQKPALIIDAQADPRFLRRMDEASDFTTGSLMCAPLVFQGQTLGVIEVVRGQDEPQRFTDEHLKVLIMFADFAAIAIANARQFKKIADLTITDDWTGLFNARYLQQSLHHEVARSRRYGHTLSVLFIDLDGFKRVNDTFGHSEGSRILACVADRIQNAIRDTDRAVRYGGDEFVVLMPETDAQEAMAVAQRLRTCISERPFHCGNSEVRVGSSMGVATLPYHGGDGRALLDAADQAMYLAKKRGGNVVELASAG